MPDLVPIRYGRMLVSPFAFYRGGALIMAADLAAAPRSGINVQACGDAHLSNFGVFGSPERRLMFDLNDFDETLPGPWEWDVKRLAASLVVAARENGYPKAAVPCDRDRSDESRIARRYGSSPRCRIWRCGTRGWTSRRSSPRCVKQLAVQAGQADGAEPCEGAHQGQHARLREADAHGERRAADHQRPTAHRACGGAHPRGGGADDGDRARVHPRLPALAADRPSDPSGAVPLRRTWPARSSGSAASARARGSPCSWASTDRIRCSSR